MPLRHIRDPKFDPHFKALPAHIRAAARRSFALLKQNPQHPSLHFKRIKGVVWSARVGRNYRALAVEASDGLHWFWIGPHAEYDRLIR